MCARVAAFLRLVERVRKRASQVTSIALEHFTIELSDRRASTQGPWHINTPTEGRVCTPQFLSSKNIKTQEAVASMACASCQRGYVLNPHPAVSPRFKYRPAQAACWNDHLCCLRALGDNDADNTLMHACAAGSAACTRVLLENMGALADAVMYDDEWIQDCPTALIAACRFGHAECAKLLFEKRTRTLLDMHTITSGLTALMVACAYGHAECVDLLISKNANVFLRDSHGWDAFAWAISTTLCSRGQSVPPTSACAPTRAVKIQSA